MRIPDQVRPGNFAEGQRLVFGCLVAAAGMFCGAMAVAMIAMLMWGGWSPNEEHTIVVIFGWSLGGFIACMAVVIVALSVGGPVRGMRASFSPKDGASFEASSEGPVSSSVVQAAAAGAAAGAVNAARPGPTEGINPETGT